MEIPKKDTYKSWKEAEKQWDREVETIRLQNYIIRDSIDRICNKRGK